MPECRVCGAQKEASEFYPAQLRKCGTIGECKECSKIRVRERARSDPKVRAYDRARAKLPHRREKSRNITKKWRDENPAGYRAHTAVSNAIRSGKLERGPCLFCGDERVHAHHRDYSKPLDVIWLCPKCHHRLHANFPETEGAEKSSEISEVRCD